MKIVISQNRAPRFWIPVPAALLTSALSARVMQEAMNQQGWQISSAQAKLFCRAVRDFGREHRGWVLVDVKASDGTGVKITL